MLRDASEPLSITTIAERLEIHPNTARFHLDALVTGGQAERVTPERRSPGRPPALFRAVRGMDPNGPRSYQLLAEVLVDTLAGTEGVRERATSAGRSWWRNQGRRVDRELGPTPRNPVTRLVALLDELGFAAEASPGAARTPDGASIGLRHCPFLDLTTGGTADRTGVVCPIHLGLMEGALAEWGGQTTVDQLDAFVEPDLCIAHLTTTGAPR